MKDDSEVDMSPQWQAMNARDEKAKARRSIAGSAFALVIFATLTVLFAGEYAKVGQLDEFSGHGTAHSAFGYAAIAGFVLASAAAVRLAWVSHPTPVRSLLFSLLGFALAAYGLMQYFIGDSGDCSAKTNKQMALVLLGVGLLIKVGSVYTAWQRGTRDHH